MTITPVARSWTVRTALALAVVAGFLISVDGRGHVDHADLPRLALRVVFEKLLQHFLRLDAFRQEVEAARPVLDHG